MTRTLYEFDMFDIKVPLLFNVSITIKHQSHLLNLQVLFAINAQLLITSNNR